MTAWVRADAGFPLILSKAYTEDGLHMFVHSENVMHDVRSGLRCGSLTCCTEGVLGMCNVISLTEADKAHL